MKRRLTFVFIVLCNTNILFSQNNQNSTPITVSGNIQLTNNGTAPAPIFALGRPALISSTYIRKAGFYFNPEFYFGLDAKPWIINARIGYNFIDNKELTLGVALNPSFFFLQRNPIINNKEEFQLQRYLANELNGEIRFRSDRKLQFNFWHSLRLDNLGVQREEFVNLAYAFENVKVGEKALFAFHPSAFYLYDADTIEGIFVSETTNFQMSNWKCNLYVQTTVPVHVTPQNAFIWNFGLNVPF